MPAVEPSYIVEAVYAPDAAQRREPFRAEHLAKVSARIATGLVVMAGALDDMSGSVLVVAADDEDEVLRLVHDDVYWREGVWIDVRLRRINRVVPQGD